MPSSPSSVRWLSWRGISSRRGSKWGSEGVGVYSVTYTVTDSYSNYLTITETVTVSDTTPPTFSSATLNETTGVFNITFDEIIDASSVDTTKIFISEAGNTNQIALTGAAVDTTVNGETITITLTESQRISVVALFEPALNFDVSAVYAPDVGLREGVEDL